MPGREHFRVHVLGRFCLHTGDTTISVHHLEISMTATMILYNGRFRTLDRRNAGHDALAIAK